MPKKKKTEEPVEDTTTSRSKSAAMALAQIEKQFGSESIRTLQSFKDAKPAKHISSGSIRFDDILGKGGFVFGRTVELFGPDGAGKSTLCLMLIARAQSMGLRCALIDHESALDYDYAETLGVQMTGENQLYISQPPNGEEGLTIAETLIKSGGFDIIIYDSVAAINPVADLQKNFNENAKMAGRASMLTRFFERNNYTISKHDVLFVFTNQLRANLSPYGADTKASGGHSLKHSASQRIEIRPVDKLVDSNGELYGVTLRTKMDKNRLGIPKREARFNLIFGKGIDQVADIVEAAASVGVIEETAGKWYTFEGNKYHGVEQIRSAIEADPKIIEELRAKTIEILGPNWGPEGK